MFSIKLDISKLVRELNSVRADSANVAAALVEEEFEQLLYNSPQYSGNFVANMRIKTGTRAGGSGEKVFKDPESVEQAFKRGQAPAIQHALSANAGFRTSATGHISKGAGWVADISIYNNWEKAGLIEGLNDDQLRMGIAHPMEKFKASLQARLGRTVEHGSSEWNRLLAKTKL